MSLVGGSSRRWLLFIVFWLRLWLIVVLKRVYYCFCGGCRCPMVSSGKSSAVFKDKSRCLVTSAHYSCSKT
jgi:hypothetical protein